MDFNYLTVLKKMFFQQKAYNLLLTKSLFFQQKSYFLIQTLARPKICSIFVLTSNQIN